MNWYRRIVQKLREQLQVVISNPANFEEKWNFSSTRIQFFSLLILFFLVSGLLFTFLMTVGPFSGYLSKNDTSIERSKLEKQAHTLEVLSNKIKTQDVYIQNITNIISGKIPFDSLSDSIPDVKGILLPSISPEGTPSEKELAKNVKNDVRTTTVVKKKITYFLSPVEGDLLTSFETHQHPGIDISTSKDMTIKACMAGTVVYAGYSPDEGFILIVEHGNGYLSVYKNAKKALKKSGTKVQTGDPIAIVGAIGEGINKPHLHFELWYNQTAVNPLDYLNFE